MQFCENFNIKFFRKQFYLNTLAATPNSESGFHIPPSLTSTQPAPAQFEIFLFYFFDVVPCGSSKGYEQENIGLLMKAFSDIVTEIFLSKVRNFRLISANQGWNSLFRSSLFRSCRPVSKALLEQTLFSLF